MNRRRNSQESRVESLRVIIFGLKPANSRLFIYPEYPVYPRLLSLSQSYKV